MLSDADESSLIVGVYTSSQLLGLRMQLLHLLSSGRLAQAACSMAGGGSLPVGREDGRQDFAPKRRSLTLFLNFARFAVLVRCDGAGLLHLFAHFFQRLLHVRSVHDVNCSNHIIFISDYSSLIRVAVTSKRRLAGFLFYLAHQLMLVDLWGSAPRGTNLCPLAFALPPQELSLRSLRWGQPGLRPLRRGTTGTRTRRR